MDQKQPPAQVSPPMPVPIWAVVIIVIVLIVLISITFFLLKRRRNRSLSVDTIHKEEPAESVQHRGSVQTIVAQQNHSKQRETTEEKIPPLPPHINNNSNDNSFENIDKSDYSDYSPPDPPQEIKISLPLPPPSTSFFSDKMELGTNDQDFYDMYLNTKKKTNNNNKGFVSIDLDSTNNFYANAASNIQQKAATIRSSFIQSLRLTQKANNRASVQQMFPAAPSTKDNILATPERKSTEIINKNWSTITTDSNKTVIDMREVRPELNTILSKQQQSFDKIDTTHHTTDATDEDLPITPNTISDLHEPVRAAKEVIRSASKKTKTRSAIITNNEEEIIDEEKKPKHEPIRYASIRGPRNSGEHMTITTGSMRRLVRESVLFDDNSFPSMPVASVSKQSKKNGMSVVDIAGWWEDTPKNQNVATTATMGASNSNISLPLFQNVTAGSNSSSTPNQYRASLSSSIFGTLSKSNGALFNEANKEEPTGVSRHSSFRRGTLNRNTLRNMTANATSNVNKSLKGLFDHSQTSINKIVPDDSQKTELDSEPIQIAIEEKTTIDPQQEEQQKQQYHSMRKKSLRSSNKTRPGLPNHNIPSSESSTKYALSDDASIPDEDQIVKNMSADTEPEHLTETMTPPANNAGEVDVIRRMLQDTWINNMKESGSYYSISSDADSVNTTSTQQSASTQQSGPTTNGSNKLNPRQQNQALLSKSLLTQQVAKRASLLARVNTNNDDTSFVSQQGPEPSASFSSSTVRTMVPEGNIEPISIRQNAIKSNNGSNKIQESSYEDKSLLLSRFSTSPTEPMSPRNSSTDSSRGHSRKSSGGNSAATALRISSGYSVDSKTWNGRAQKRSSKQAPVLHEGSLSPTTATDGSPLDQSFGRNSVNKRQFFSTMRKGQKTRGGIPWMMEEDEERTPAQIERDTYLGKP